MKNTNKRICIGKITSSHGVKGLVKILPYCEDINLLNGDILCQENSDKTLNITIKNSAGKYILAQIEGITNPEDAKSAKCSLYILRETLPKIDNDDEFYIEDLAGLNALNPKGELIGTVIALQNFGASDMLEVKPNSGASYFVPFQDEYVSKIDLDNNSLVISNADNFIIE